MHSLYKDLCLKHLFWKPATHLWDCILKYVLNFRITTLNSYEIFILIYGPVADKNYNCL